MANPSLPDRPSKLLAEWFWTDRWIGSSAFLLPIEPRGLYREMLTQAWRRGGSLPNDPVAIQRAVGCTASEWKRCWPQVERYWRVVGDTLVNDTQASVIADAIAAHGRAVERGRKGGKASARSRAQVQEQVEAQVQEQPELKRELKHQPPSPSPSLSPTPIPQRPVGSGESFPRARTGAGVMAGALPRDHMNCHQPCIRVCLSEKQHAILRERHGGTDADLDAFYAEVRRNIHGPVGQKPWDFWQEQFSARFGASTGDSRTAGNLAAAARFVARGQQ